MDLKDIRTLKILEEIDTDVAPSQRDLAGKLNISLGLVNSFIKRLVQKGYFKVTTIPKNRVRYILTPRGVAEKSRLTYEYIRYSFQFYKAARHKLRETFKQFENQKIGRVVFWGTGELAEIAFLSMQETRINLVAIVDDKMSGEKFMGHRVIKTSEATLLTYDRILVTSMDSSDDVVKTILHHGIPRSSIKLLS